MTEQTSLQTENKKLSRSENKARLRQIIEILNKHEVVKGLTPEKLRAILEDLGPTYIKLGQIMSMRSDMIPQAYCDALTQLRSSVPPMPFDEVRRVVEGSLGKPIEEVYSDFNEEPIGAASIAQAHEARLKDGTHVVVKVQREGIYEIMSQDMTLLRKAAGILKLAPGTGEILDFGIILDEMWKVSQEEMNFTIEAQNAETFYKNNEDVAFATCPRIYREETTPQVLTMEFIDGISVDNKAKLLENGYDLDEIGAKLADNYIKQVIEDGFFHADPHPGNIIIREGKIVYIDLGIMGRLTPAERAGFARIIHAVSVQSSSELADALISFAVSRGSGQVDHAKLLADTDNILRTYASCDVSDLDIGAFLNDVLVVTRASKCQMPSTITNVARGIVTVEGTVAPYIPNESIVGIINGHIMRSTDPVEQAKDTLVDAALVMRRAAEGLSSAAEYSGEALRMMTRGQLKMNMEVLGSEAPLLRLSKIVNRMTMGILAAGLFMGSSLFATAGLGPEILDVPAVSFFGFTGAFILSAWIVVDIWRRK